MHLLTGTSGYSYPQWRGSFYPAELRDEDMLPHYAGRLPTVEINNTFYRIPKPDVVDTWKARAPAPASATAPRTGARPEPWAWHWR